MDNSTFKCLRILTFANQDINGWQFKTKLSSGASIPPEAMMHFRRVSDFPPISRIVLDLVKISPFPTKIFLFSSAQISDLFYNHWLQMLNFPLFSLFSTFKFTCFYILYVFCSPLLWPWCIYASHNARTGRPLLSLSRRQINQDKGCLGVMLIFRRQWWEGVVQMFNGVTTSEDVLIKIWCVFPVP